jgi:FkbM family methyltransferase
MALIAPATRAAAALCERSALLAGLLRHTRFPLRCRVASELRRLPGPRERIAVSHGARYRLDLEDQLQRAIFLGCYESAALRRVLRLIPERGTCIDVGANVGFYALPLALRVGPGGTVHAFEADPRNAERLRANTELSGLSGVLRVHDAAVTSREGRVTLFRSDAAHSGWGSLTEFKDIAADRAEVEAVTLDSFLAREGITHVDFLKVDVEAGEFELLEGARSALTAGVFRQVFIEFNGPRLAERGRTFDDLLGCFAGHRYHPAPQDSAFVAKLRRSALPPETRVVNLRFQRDGRNC